MAKLVIDHDGEVFYTYKGGYKFSHKIYSSLTAQLRAEFKKDFKGAKATKKARRAIEDKEF